MTYLKLATIGNATAVVLTDDLLARLNLSAGDTVRAEATPDGGVLLTAGREAKRAMIKQIMVDYDEALRELAK